MFPIRKGWAERKENNRTSTSHLHPMRDYQIKKLVYVREEEHAGARDEDSIILSSETINNTATQ